MTGQQPKQKMMTKLDFLKQIDDLNPLVKEFKNRYGREPLDDEELFDFAENYYHLKKIIQLLTNSLEK